MKIISSDNIPRVQIVIMDSEKMKNGKSKNLSSPKRPRDSNDFEEPGRSKSRRHADKDSKSKPHLEDHQTKSRKMTKSNDEATHMEEHTKGWSLLSFIFTWLHAWLIISSILAPSTIERLVKKVDDFSMSNHVLQEDQFRSESILATVEDLEKRVDTWINNNQWSEDDLLNSGAEGENASAMIVFESDIRPRPEIIEDVTMMEEAFIPKQWQSEVNTLKAQLEEAQRIIASNSMLPPSTLGVISNSSNGSNTSSQNPHSSYQGRSTGAIPKYSGGNNTFTATPAQPIAVNNQVWDQKTQEVFVKPFDYPNQVITILSRKDIRAVIVKGLLIARMNIEDLSRVRGLNGTLVFECKTAVIATTIIGIANCYPWTRDQLPLMTASLGRDFRFAPMVDIYVPTPEEDYSRVIEWIQRHFAADTSTWRWLASPATRVGTLYSSTTDENFATRLRGENKRRVTFCYQGHFTMGSVTLHSNSMIGQGGQGEEKSNGVKYFKLTNNLFQKQRLSK